MEVKKIFVAGAGLMGGGITQVSAQAGYQVVMQDLSDHILTKSLDTIRWSVGKLVDKGRVKGTAKEIMDRIKTTTRVELADSADFVFEAVVENLEIKQDLFTRLDMICPSHTILGTNTSAIPVIPVDSDQRLLVS